MEEYVIIRKPTDDEQRLGKIVTSDYMISAVTIHSSVLKTLGWVEKVYRAKKATITRSNKNQISKAKATLKTFTTSKKTTFKKIFDILKEANEHKDFMDEITNNGLLKWTEVKNDIPMFVIENKFKHPNALVRTIARIKELDEHFDNILDGMSEYKYNSSHSVAELMPIFNEYFDKIKASSVKGHTQTFLLDTVKKHQKNLTKRLGEGFTPSMFAKTLSSDRLNTITNEWHIDLTKFQGTWDDLCNYLYSPTMIAEIRNKLGVKVRARSHFETRKGVESNDKKKFTRIINNKRKLLGTNFNISEEEAKIEKAKQNVKIKENQLEEGKWVLNHAIANNADNIHELKQAVDSLRNKYNYAVKSLEKLEKNFIKKKDALEVIKEYEMKQNLLNEMIEETRSGEEISALEHEELLEAIRRQKKEKQIPYYTWRFVCDKIDTKTAQLIEAALEDNLNKGSGVNGEDGYINVTAFPMERSFEFFVDYPKNCNLFRAFKNKGEMLSRILIDGVARHLGKSFVSCNGETYINNPMEKTMNGDMLEWVGI